MTDNPLAHIYRESIDREGGDWSSAYLDVSGAVEDPRRMAEHRRRTVTDALDAAGAPRSDIDAMRDILSDPPGVPSPASRYLLVRDGEVALDEVLPGAPLAPEATGYGKVPDLIPLLRHRPSSFTYVVVEAGRDGGDVRLYRAGSSAPESDATIEGRTDSLNKVHAGGWSNARYQRHSEEVWKHNMDDLASAVDRLVLDHHPRLLVLAGDVRASQLLEEHLSSESKSVLSTVPTYTRPDGASDDALQTHVAAELARIATEDRDAAIDHLANRAGSDAASGVGPVVSALQQAQAESVLLDPDRLRERTLLALDAAPWIATVPEDALDASIVGEVSADAALVRAALLTDADLVLVGPGDLPNDAAIAASLRWPTGPAVPGA